ncbi:olfactory receptor 5V1-like [Tachyglossus aculeatus]|uniref:olfactory receptor 5V1-like n=1 Tax=Tachyglossus aculeatus TaxID=9261 RepID=UPI0018F6424C|nr:olfactory receptor 5V1-like [Tachyglossus aculeatus]
MENQTALMEFILLGFSNLLGLQVLFFVIFLTIYFCTLVWNVFILWVTLLDTRLHSPMYFFLRNLALLDLCYTTTIVPQMLAHLLAERKNISFARCTTQLFAFIFFVGVECLLLAGMAFDRYLAICQPLRYSVVMERGLSIQLAAASWAGGLVNSMAHTALTFRLPFCGNDLIDYFFCDILPLLHLSCGDTSVNELVLLSVGVLIGWIPFMGIIFSYLYILVTILTIRSSEGRRKAFSTCASHLTIVLLYCGSAIFTYVRPISADSLDHARLISVVYSMVTPMLNPIIYTLRNKDIKMALRALGERWILPQAASPAM